MHLQINPEQETELSIKITGWASGQNHPEEKRNPHLTQKKATEQLKAICNRKTISRFREQQGRNAKYVFEPASGRDEDVVNLLSIVLMWLCEHSGRSTGVSLSKQLGRGIWRKRYIAQSMELVGSCEWHTHFWLMVCRMPIPN
jgi:hypothetical protein